jgi:uncharacterized protein (UPF0332 family)
MIYKDSHEYLEKEGLIKRCETDWNAIRNLLKRAYADLKTAERNIIDDEECAYTYAYTAMLRSGLALMFSKGYRPEIRDKHLTVVKFATPILGTAFRAVLNNYDFMRKKRNRFIYEPDIPCSRKEADEALAAGREFVAVIRELIETEAPEGEFDF